MILPWTALQPSALERRWRVAATLVAAAVCLAILVAGLVRDPRHPALLWAAAIGSIAATLFAIFWRRPVPRLELAISDEGAVRVRSIEGQATTEERVLRAVFGAPWLISLSDSTNLCVVWPDSMPADAFRRLWVCVRWARAARPALPGAPGPRIAASMDQHGP